MTATIDTNSDDSGADLIIDDLGAPQICAAWAQADLVDDYVVYERENRWVFAGGKRASVVLTTDTIATTIGSDTTDESWSGLPAGAISQALAGLPFPHWRVYGWIAFDFCAPGLGAGGHLEPGSVLAHLVVPEFEAWVEPDGIRVEGAGDDLAARLRELAASAPRSHPVSPRSMPVDDDPTDYRGRVAKAVAEIHRGEYEKVIISRGVDVPFDVDIAATYGEGRKKNNPARSFLLRLGGLEAAGFSPELVGSVDVNRKVVTEPLAGTRAFGRSPELDAAARAELVSDSKEIVEHAVSVRTSFTEVDSVAVDGTTAVTEFMVVRERGSVQHLASTVQATLAPEFGPWDALEVLFPSVTASGIPKPAAVDAIYRLEDTRRGLYSGAVLTASSEGELEAALALRTVFRENGRSWVRAGAGIVGQSSPEREFTETCEKLGSIAPYLVERTSDNR
jgi:salicylate synthetase